MHDPSVPPVGNSESPLHPSHKEPHEPAPDHELFLNLPLPKEISRSRPMPRIDPPLHVDLSTSLYQGEGVVIRLAPLLLPLLAIRALTPVSVIMKVVLPCTTIVLASLNVA